MIKRPDLEQAPLKQSTPQPSRCCSPARTSMGPGVVRLAHAPRTLRPLQTARPRRPLIDCKMLVLEGGAFEMGGDNDAGFANDGELPVHSVRLPTFALDAHATTNRDFAVFVAETGYRTEAERIGWSFVFHLLLPCNFPPTRGVAHAPWWRQVEGACWKRPEGPDSVVDSRLDHPVVHVSWNDAQAYAVWAGKRLPTEAEWEYAARGGIRRARFPWGDELTPDGEHRSNIWQGRFPTVNTVEDGHLGTAPVDAYQKNGFGLYNMAGNVWEWCEDWFDAAYYGRSPVDDPRGPVAGTERVIRGGSYLCHSSYCARYRVGARSRNTPDSSSGNTGFRCAVSLQD
jgi:sulfatase modifying factor 1